ncbi:MFS transporter [Psychrobacillus sp.]|uniref:MFS transporter n=1 Tax=Psychrobacillus sp. TaxID=1871623 RepID=UPI0028BEE84B|nr:MFS transporter [Psychrobacillus sp.]
MTTLPRKIKIFYALGQLGWSILAAIIGTWLMYFYLSPEEAGIDVVIPQGSIFLGITVIGLVMGFGILIDAFTDPWIANLSDKSKHPLGRRIPYMRKSALPLTILLILVFFVPVQGGIHAFNSIWLLIVLPLYYIAFTAYVIPYTALLGELGSTTEDRIDLSTYISITWFLGLAIATLAPNIWGIFMDLFDMEKTAAIKLTFIVLAILAFVLMLVPAYTIDEKKYCTSKPSSLELKSSLKAVFKNINFRYFLYSEFGYWLSNGFFQATLVYYITVLALQKESDVGLVVTAVGVLSFMQYPLVNRLSKKYGKKNLMIVSFFLLILSFIYVAFIGKLPFDGFAQLIPVIVLISIPSAITGVLPNAIIADCAAHDAYTTGENREAMYFGIRSFLNKVGGTLAVILLPSILAIGKSTENDVGIRISAIVAALVVVASLIAFLKYDEKGILSTIKNFNRDKISEADI